MSMVPTKVLGSTQIEPAGITIMCYSHLFQAFALLFNFLGGNVEVIVVSSVLATIWKNLLGNLSISQYSSLQLSSEATWW
jgi:hypothetical protein